MSRTPANQGSIGSLLINASAGHLGAFQDVQLHQTVVTPIDVR